MHSTYLCVFWYVINSLIVGYFGGRRSVEKRADKWKCSVKREAIEFVELRNWKRAAKTKDVWRNGIRESIT
jgi:hypothetical protein